MRDYIIDEFYEGMKNVNFDVYGVLDSSNKIHTLGTDSKLIGRIFEMIAEPILSGIAKRHGLVLLTPDKQNFYPDFIIMEKGKPETKIAIDVKSSYVKKNNSSFVFTLGAYGSYMRDNTKNIVGCYSDYIRHYAICFTYRRNDRAQESQVFDYEERNEIKCPFFDVEYCIQEKYKIAGDVPGSGNTENIGSFRTNSMELLKKGKGPFAELGIDVYDIYWKYYPRYTNPIKHYTSLPGFAEWFFKQDPKEIKLFREFDYDSVAERLKTYTLKL